VIGAAIGSAAGGPPPLEWHDDPALLTPPPAAAPRSTGIKPGATDIATGRARAAAVRPELDEDAFDLRRPSSLSVAALFCYICLGVSLLALLFSSRWRGEGLLMGVILLLLAFPAVQLASAAVVFLVLLCSRRSDRVYQMKRLGKITLGVVLGAMAGVSAMWLLYRAFR
jgi:hypothetical protein